MKRSGKVIKFLDLYCGAGGYSTGFAEAMRELGLEYYEVAVNHWNRAIETMQANHPDVVAMQVDISAVNPCDIDADVIDLLHASPSCTHHSRAKGGKPCDDQLRSQSFASELARDLCSASSGAIRYNGKPIVKPETFIFNMRVHIVPDEYITIPFEVSCAQELILPFYDHGFMERRARLLEEKFKSYTAIDFQNRFMLPER